MCECGAFACYCRGEYLPDRAPGIPEWVVGHIHKKTGFICYGGIRSMIVKGLIDQKTLTRHLRSYWKRIIRFPTGQE